MKPKPLKGKYKRKGISWYKKDKKDGYFFEWFFRCSDKQEDVLNDVKSAVELLVQKIKRIDGLKYVYYDNKAKKWFFDYEKLKEDIINLIKEAFEDVVDKEEEE